MARSGSFSDISKPRSSIITRRCPSSLATTQLDDKRKEKPTLTELTKCRSLKGGAGEAKEKRAAEKVVWGAGCGCGVRVCQGRGEVVAKDMPPFMMVHVVTFARRVFDGMEKFSSKTVALSLKKGGFVKKILIFGCM